MKIFSYCNSFLIFQSTCSYGTISNILLKRLKIWTVSLRKKQGSKAERKRLKLKYRYIVGKLRTSLKQHTGKKLSSTKSS